MVEYNPLMPEILEDPLPIYARLRDEAPAYYVEEHDCWALSRFEDIWEQSGDNASYSASLRGTTPAHLITKQMAVFPSVNMMDPPEHTQNRALISGAFKPKRVAALSRRPSNDRRRNTRNDLEDGTSSTSSPTTSRRSRWRFLILLGSAGRGCRPALQLRESILRARATASPG